MTEPICTITLQPQGLKITAKTNDQLLETLIAHKILLRADCGGKGICGKCRVELVGQAGEITGTEACTLQVTGDMILRIPEASLLSSNIISKPPATLPMSFTSEVKELSAGTEPEKLGELEELGIAVDLGTTTIAIYLCNTRSREVLFTVSMKNPQALYGDDVMSRIGWINRSTEKLARLQQLVVRTIEWGVKELFDHCGAGLNELVRIVVAGNPTMIHILLGVDPFPIGVSPYQPAFCEDRQTMASLLGFDLPDVPVHTFNQLSGFIGGDILAATLATELESEPSGTLLIDLGTNGELVLKGHDTFFVTSCATGPVFEGAALSCGLQAVPGAIDRVTIDTPDSAPGYRVLQKDKGQICLPSGLCGSGVISAVAALLRAGLVDKSGLLKISSQSQLQVLAKTERKYLIVPAELSATGRDIAINQKDIRAVQLGKAALITGIEFLLRAAGLTMPEKILIAGAFGFNLDTLDILTLGMIPLIEPTRIHMTGNSAGAGAIMALCDEKYRKKTINLVAKVSVIELTANIDFQNTFIQRLGFPDTRVQ
jgi:uncharacterized 2Fe-2S/4Fe-4S cluster protein (DUF4445 family)